MKRDIVYLGIILLVIMGWAYIWYAPVDKNPDSPATEEP